MANVNTRQTDKVKLNAGKLKQNVNHYSTARRIKP